MSRATEETTTCDYKRFLGKKKIIKIKRNEKKSDVTHIFSQRIHLQKVNPGDFLSHV